MAPKATPGDSPYPAIYIDAGDIAKITIRQLATHTSGLDRVGKIFAKMVSEDVITCYLRYRKEDLYEELRIAELSYPTGQGWIYSIIGMGLLGHIMELATGSSYEDLLKTIICEPLGLKDTGYTMSDAQLSRMVRAVDSNGRLTPNWYHDVLMPQGGPAVDDVGHADLRGSEPCGSV